MHTLSLATLVSVFPVGALHDLVPVIGTATPFIFVICILTIKAIKQAHEQRLRHETIRLAIEKGQSLPPEILNPARTDPPPDDRKAGLILIAVAIGVALFFYGFPFPQDAQAVHGVMWLASVPGLIGVALLINWTLNRRPRNQEPRS
ncbi:hypothetical protein GALL_85550 [mine drainage metagenome]|uniref:DUF6249 domain-containing protein n=1 Tax=mine drainage metagenome TaxID=410659 RepID=A0A1J5SLI0_9ZZZZ